ncbi:uncharacterized protein LOC142984651 [Anticarsia gemmatalis]|uniref:uncharacterized protein LOC142984651 n=1 Tax=Anticarsia gemmatalis TaxID=129554 RepID=UPI003F7766B9
MSSTYLFVVLLLLSIASLQAISPGNDVGPQRYGSPFVDVNENSDSEINESEYSDSNSDSQNVESDEWNRNRGNNYIPADLYARNQNSDDEDLSDYLRNNDQIIPNSETNNFDANPRNEKNLAFYFTDLLKNLLIEPVVNRQQISYEPEDIDVQENRPLLRSGYDDRSAVFAGNILTLINTGTITNFSASITLEGRKFIIHNETISTGVHLANANITGEAQAEIIIELLSFRKKHDLKILGKKGKKKLIRAIIKNIAEGTILIINSGTMIGCVFEFPGPGTCPTLPPVTETTVTETTPTEIPTTASPTTESPTTASPTTESPTTASPPTESPTTASPPTEKPTTASPPTEKPTTASPPTEKPTTASPPTEKPTTASPPTESPTTASPPTESPTTASPSTESPAPETTTEPTKAPVKRDLEAQKEFY